MATKIEDFYVGTTKVFSLLIKIDGAAQDISGDAVTLKIKENKSDADAQAKLTKAADVATRGASGYADFELEPADTKTIDPDKYYMDAEWVTGAKERIVLDQDIHLLERVSDVPA